MQDIADLTIRFVEHLCSTLPFLFVFLLIDTDGIHTTRRRIDSMPMPMPNTYYI